MLRVRKSDVPIEWSIENDHAGWRRAKSLLRTDPTRAVAELRMLAEKGSPLCMLELGRVHALGIGTPTDPIKSEKYFQQAAATGSVRAHHALGRLYLRLRRYEDARNALGFAAARGYVPAIHDLGKMHFLGLGSPQDIEKAEVLLERASAQGNVFAKRLLARLLVKNSSTYPKKLRGIWLHLRAFWDFIVVLATEGLDSEKLIR